MYKRQEIGVMKVLGCDMGNIRNMFLIESGFIGLAGGDVYKRQVSMVSVCSISIKSTKLTLSPSLSTPIGS